MKSVMVITNHLDEDPCYRLRMGAFIAPLAERGIQLEIKIWPKGILARRRVARLADQFDAVILHRKLIDLIPAKILARRAKKIVYDVDDAVWFLQTRQSFITRLRLRLRLRATTAIVDHFAPGNEFLAERFRQYGKPVTVVPTVVDPARYQPKVHVPSGEPRLIWIGTSPNLAYIRAILPALAEARRRVPNLRLRIICDQTLDTDAIPIDFVPWSIAAEASALIEGDIGIAPTPLNPWTLGKSGFKIVQYMAAGLPVVASPVGANEQIVQTVGDHPTGILPKDLAAWTDAIVRLATDHQLRAALGTAGRQRCESHYSLSHAADLWANMLQ